MKFVLILILTLVGEFNARNDLQTMPVSACPIRITGEFIKDLQNYATYYDYKALRDEHCQLTFTERIQCLKRVMGDTKHPEHKKAAMEYNLREAFCEKMETKPDCSVDYTFTNFIDDRSSDEEIKGTYCKVLLDRRKNCLMEKGNLHTAELKMWTDICEKASKIKHSCVINPDYVEWKELIKSAIGSSKTAYCKTMLTNRRSCLEDIDNVSDPKNDSIMAKIELYVWTEICEKSTNRSVCPTNYADFIKEIPENLARYVEPSHKIYTSPICRAFLAKRRSCLKKEAENQNTPNGLYAQMEMDIWSEYCDSRFTHGACPLDLTSVDEEANREVNHSSAKTLREIFCREVLEKRKICLEETIKDMSALEKVRIRAETELKMWTAICKLRSSSSSRSSSEREKYVFLLTLLPFVIFMSSSYLHLAVGCL